MANIEIWEKIPGFNSFYQVSSLGNVRSLKGNKTLFLHPNGYLQVNLYKNDKTKSRLVHRLVASAFIPNNENKPQVNHINGDKTDNKISNLEWATAKENSQHAIKTGLKPKRTHFKRVKIKNNIFESVKDAAIFLRVKRTTVNAMLSGQSRNYLDIMYI